MASLSAATSGRRPRCCGSSVRGGEWIRRPAFGGADRAGARRLPPTKVGNRQRLHERPPSGARARLPAPPAGRHAARSDIRATHKKPTIGSAELSSRVMCIASTRRHMSTRWRNVVSSAAAGPAAASSTRSSRSRRSFSTQSATSFVVAFGRRWMDVELPVQFRRVSIEQCQRLVGTAVERIERSDDHGQAVPQRPRCRSCRYRHRKSPSAKAKIAGVLRQ